MSKNKWIGWRSGNCPVPHGTIVRVRFRNGNEFTWPAERFRWVHTGLDSDVIAYFVGEEQFAGLPSTKCSNPSAAPTEPSAPAMLTRASDLLLERGKQYDQPQGERSMARAVSALNTVLGRQALTESEGWLLMQILKDVRDRQREAPHVDSLEDYIAYAALKAEARQKEGTAK